MDGDYKASTTQRGAHDKLQRKHSLYFFHFAPFPYRRVLLAISLRLTPDFFECISGKAQHDHKFPHFDKSFLLNEIKHFSVKHGKRFTKMLFDTARVSTIDRRIHRDQFISVRFIIVQHFAEL